MAGMRATKKALEFVREMDLPRFRGCDEVRVADFTVEEAAMYDDFLRRDLKKRSQASYEKAKSLGKSFYTARSSLSSEQHERRKMLGSKNSHLIYAKKKALAAYGRSRGITMLLNTGLQEMRDTLNRHGVEDETIQEIEDQAVVTSKRKDPDEDGVLRPGPSKKPKPEEEEDEEDDDEVADVSSLNRKQLGKKALRDFLRANPHIQPPPKTAKALRDAWPEDAKRYRTYVQSLQPDKYKAMEERNNAKRKGKRGEYNKQRRENNHERVLEIERKYRDGKGQYRVSRKCSIQGCDSYARSPGTLCKAHGGGVRCKHPGCDKGTQGPTGLCISHGGGYKCAVCDLFSVQRKEGHCWTCRKGTERWHQFEYMVSEHLKKDNLLCNWSYRDSTMPCSTNRRRGDFTWILPDRVIILEVDEDCHRYYERDCEIKRVLELHEQCRGLPLLMLRFNPIMNLLDTMVNHLHDMRTGFLPEILQVDFLGYPDHLEYDVANEVERMLAERSG